MSHPENPTTAAIYLRVSSEDQARHGYSLAAQRESCSQRATILGATAIREFSDEGVTGSILERPGLKALRSAVRRGTIQLVVIYDPDRFARHLSHQLLVTEEIERAGARLEFVNFDWQNTPEGKLFYSMRGAIAEYEREKIRLRTMTGRMEKARQGKYPMGIAPYGYRYADGQLHVVESEAAVVRRIFQDIVLGEGLNTVAKGLTAEGIPTQTGLPVWHRQVVRQIARNPVYMGTFYANRLDTGGMYTNKFRPPEEKISLKVRDQSEWIPVSVQAIIDEETWSMAQTVMDRAQTRWSATAKEPYLLSGLLRCGFCGQTMTGRRQRNWGRIEPEYTCRKNTAGARHPGCTKRPRVPSHPLDELVWERVVGWLRNPPLLADLLRPPTDVQAMEAELGRTQADLKRLRAGQQNLLTVLEQGWDGTDEVLDRLNRMKKQEAALLTHQARLCQTLAEHGQALDLNAYTTLAQEVLGSVDRDLTLDDRRNVVRQFVKALIVGDDTLSIHAIIPTLAAWKEPERGRPPVTMAPWQTSGRP